MADQIIFTSALRGVKPGASGYCTVLRSPGIRGALVHALEKISVFEHTKCNKDRLIYSYRQIQIRDKTYYTLSRVSDAGKDYSGRTNFLAHHLAFEKEELPDRSPVDILLNWPGWFQKWEGEPREEGLDLQSFQQIPVIKPPAQLWKEQGVGVDGALKLASDTQSALTLRSGSCSDEMLLQLLGEALAVRSKYNKSYRYAWTTPFSVGLAAVANAKSFKWLALKTADDYALSSTGTLLDLDVPLPGGITADEELTAIAREGSYRPPPKPIPLESGHSVVDEVAASKSPQAGGRQRPRRGSAAPSKIKVGASQAPAGVKRAPAKKPKKRVDWFRQEYDENGNVTSYEDSDDYWFRYEYDENGNETYYENSHGVKRGTKKGSCTGKVGLYVVVSCVVLLLYAGGVLFLKPDSEQRDQERVEKERTQAQTELVKIYKEHQVYPSNQIDAEKVDSAFKHWLNKKDNEIDYNRKAPIANGSNDSDKAYNMAAVERLWAFMRAIQNYDDHIDQIVKLSKERNKKEIEELFSKIEPTKLITDKGHNDISIYWKYVKNDSSPYREGEKRNEADERRVEEALAELKDFLGNRNRELNRPDSNESKGNPAVVLNDPPVFESNSETVKSEVDELQPEEATVILLDLDQYARITFRVPGENLDLEKIAEKSPNYLSRRTTFSVAKDIEHLDILSQSDWQHKYVFDDEDEALIPDSLNIDKYRISDEIDSSSRSYAIQVRPGRDEPLLVVLVGEDWESTLKLGHLDIKEKCTAEEAFLKLKPKIKGGVLETWIVANEEDYRTNKITEPPPKKDRRDISPLIEVMSEDSEVQNELSETIKIFNSWASDILVRKIENKKEKLENEINGKENDLEKMTEYKELSSAYKEIISETRKDKTIRGYFEAYENQLSNLDEKRKKEVSKEEIRRGNNNAHRALLNDHALRKKVEIAPEEHRRYVIFWKDKQWRLSYNDKYKLLKISEKNEDEIKSGLEKYMKYKNTENERMQKEAEFERFQKKPYEWGRLEFINPTTGETIAIVELN